MPLDITSEDKLHFVALGIQPKKRLYWDGKYKGELKDDKREGYGIMHYLIGDTYEGQWTNDKLNGEGEKHALPDHSGVYEWKNRDKYIGSFNNSKREGKGKLLLKNGNFYQGEFKGRTQ